MELWNDTHSPKFGEDSITHKKAKAERGEVCNQNSRCVMSENDVAGRSVIYLASMPPSVRPSVRPPVRVGCKGSVILTYTLGAHAARPATANNANAPQHKVMSAGG